MKILATGAKRKSGLAPHTITENDLTEITYSDDTIKGFVLSSQDPGIGKGEYNLTIELNKSEIFKLFEALMSSNAQKANKHLDNDIDKLFTEIKELKEELAARKIIEKPNNILGFFKSRSGKPK